MPYVNPTSATLHRNRSLTKGSMADDIRHELGLNDEEDDEMMGRQQDSPGFFRSTAQWGVNAFTSLAGGMVKGNFG